MKVDGKAYRTIWLAADGWAVEIIDQTRLPHSFETTRLETMEQAAHAIRAMLVRGAEGMKPGGHSVAMRQLFGGQEVGRVTWQFHRK